MSWLSYLMIGSGTIVLANVIWLGAAAWRLNRAGTKGVRIKPVVVKSRGSLTLVRVERRVANDA